MSMLGKIWALLRAILRAKRTGQMVVAFNVDRREFLKLTTAAGAIALLPGPVEEAKDTVRWVGTVSGRMSSSAPNLSNVPRGDDWSEWCAVIHPRQFEDLKALVEEEGGVVGEGSARLFGVDIVSTTAADPEKGMRPIPVKGLTGLRAQYATQLPLKEEFRDLRKQMLAEFRGIYKVL